MPVVKDLVIFGASAFADIAHYYAAGVRLFATDSESDVLKLAQAAPGARVYVRLLAEPSASVLSVGLSVGFTSQSNFYEAFREIAGTTPGQFRKLHIPVPE